jgi:tRNA (guanine37-N1)-methyltransferase
MKFAVLTIFPDMFTSFLAQGIVRKAVTSGHIDLAAIDIRDFADGKHRVTDDRPFGGGPGMVMKPEPLVKAIENTKRRFGKARTVLLSPQGQVFNQQMARDLAGYPEILLVCGRYEGVDERVCHDHVDLEISIGDYVLSGGELAAMVIVEAVTRLLPGALGAENGAAKDSFSDHLLDYPQFTRPRVFRDTAVPEVLLTGNHRRIDNWRLENALLRTLLRRPGLLYRKRLTAEEKQILNRWHRELTLLLEST